MDFGSSARSAEKRTRWKWDCCEFICGAPTVFQGYGIEKNRIEIIYGLSVLERGSPQNIPVRF